VSAPSDISLSPCSGYIPVCKPAPLDICRYVDPNDPTKIFLQQPAAESQMRRRNYHGPADNAY
jgi:hypothetical protein